MRRGRSQLCITRDLTPQHENHVTCEFLNCEHHCNLVQGIPQCSCITGFTLDIDGRSCTDTDECREGPRLCHHGCMNTVGSFICTCLRGYVLTDNGVTCRRLHDYSHSSCRHRIHKQGHPCVEHLDKLTESLNTPQHPPCAQQNGPCITTGEEPELLPPCGDRGCGQNQYPNVIGRRNHKTVEYPESPCDSVGCQPSRYPTLHDEVNLGNDLINLDESSPTIVDETPCSGVGCFNNKQEPQHPKVIPQISESDPGQMIESPHAIFPCPSTGCPPPVTLLDWEAAIYGPCPKSGCFPALSPPPVGKSSMPCPLSGCAMVNGHNNGFDYHGTELESPEKPFNIHDIGDGPCPKQGCENTQMSDIYETRKPVKNARKIIRRTNPHAKRMNNLKRPLSNIKSRTGYVKEMADQAKFIRGSPLRIKRIGNKVVSTHNKPSTEEPVVLVTSGISRRERNDRDKNKPSSDKSDKFNPNQGQGRSKLRRTSKRKRKQRRQRKQFRRKYKNRGIENNGMTSNDSNSSPVDRSSGKTGPLSSMPSEVANKSVSDQPQSTESDGSNFAAKVKSFLENFNRLKRRQKYADTTSLPTTKDRATSLPRTNMDRDGHISLNQDTTTHLPPITIPSTITNCPESMTTIESEDRIECVSDIYNTNVECPDGMISVNNHGQTQCIPCPPGQFQTNTSGGAKCQYNETEVSSVDLDCPDGQILTHSGERYICVEEGSTIPVCSPGSDLVNTENGFVCVSTTTTTDRPCPDGLQEVITSVGRTCRYMEVQQQPVPQCHDNQELVKTERGYKCRYNSEITPTTPFQCNVGFILLDTIEGQKCVRDPTLRSDEASCPEGLILSPGPYGDQCIPQRQISRNMEYPCPLGQELITTESGQVICQYKTSDTNDLHNTETFCSDGEILTQGNTRFVCAPSDVDVTEWICSPGEVIVQLTSGLACVEKQQTTIICQNNFRLFWNKDQFTCLDLKSPNPTNPYVINQVTCNTDEILIVDDDGHRCVTMSTEADLCGNGYAIDTSSEGFRICKSKVMKLKCPEGYQLSETDHLPECLPFIGSNQPVSPCEDNYNIELQDGDIHCALHSSNPCSSDITSGCGRTLESLQMACYPQCANGGVCINGTCSCPQGVTGTACQTDVNECLLLPDNYCEYRCENNFGSYQCVCPSGLTMNSDGRTCKAAGCVPECLNGGHCMSGTCYCTAGFEGNFCQTDIDECSRYDGLCQHHCRNTYGSYACVCPPGSRLRPDGRTCFNRTCIPQCKNGGQCVRHRCQCTAGYNGVICQLDINECDNSPCSHRCVNIPGSYYCACPEGSRLELDRRTCRGNRRKWTYTLMPADDQKATFNLWYCYMYWQVQLISNNQQTLKTSKFSEKCVVTHCEDEVYNHYTRILEESGRSLPQMKEEALETFQFLQQHI